MTSPATVGFAYMLPRSDAHTCAGYGCLERIPRQHLMCEDHWGLVPKWLRFDLTQAFDPRAEFCWPLNLVEQAIRSTMCESDLRTYIAKLAESEQVSLFAAPTVSAQ